MHPLHSFWLKLNRANAHLKTLQREVEAWLAKKPYAIFGEYDPGPPDQYVFRVRFFAPVPPDWGVLIGEFAHNARSALDHLAWQVVTYGGGIPSRNTQFPIVLLREKWKDQGLRRLVGAKRRHLRLIRERQPYRRVPLLKQIRNPQHFASAEHPLAILAALNNEDKHRVLTTTPAAMRSIGYDLRPVHDVSHISLDRAAVDFDSGLEDGSKLLSVPITVSGPNPEVELHRQETVEIAIRYRVEFPGGYSIGSQAEVGQLLSTILEEEWGIFEVFVNEFR